MIYVPDCPYVYVWLRAIKFCLAHLLLLFRKYERGTVFTSAFIVHTSSFTLRLPAPSLSLLLRCSSALGRSARSAWWKLRVPALQSAGLWCSRTSLRAERKL